MLKRVILKNFVHFPDIEILDFDGGPYFFIGENRSGKSSAFEAIRRCMSTSKNVFLSSSHEPTKLSVVICAYTKPDDDFVSCYFRTPDKLGDYSTNIAVKLVATRKGELFVDLLKKKKHDYPVKQEFLLDKDNQDELKKMKDLLRRDISSVEIESLESLLEIIIFGTEEFKKFQSDKREAEYSEKTQCESFLEANIDRQVVITNPMRSICPLQWTNSSKRMDRKDDTKFLNELSVNSEILNWYLDQEAASITESERKSVDYYFRILTEDSKIKFMRRNGIIEVKDNGNIVSLEKTPEGIFEAMTCAILLSIKRFKTICLEEPGRGMHIQMIERLRDLILKKIVDKTVIVITHTQAFLTFWNVERIFFFRKRQDANGQTFAVVKGGDLFHDDKNKTQRMMTNYSISTIFFARRVLLVEGESELKFFSALKSILFEDDSLIEEVVRETNKADEPEKATEANMADESGHATEAEMADESGNATEENMAVKSGKSTEANMAEHSGNAMEANMVDQSENGTEANMADQSGSAKEELRRFLSSLHIMSLNGEPNGIRFERICKMLKLERYLVLDFDALLRKEKGGKEQKPAMTQFFKNFGLQHLDKEFKEEGVVVLEDEGIFIWKDPTNKSYEQLKKSDGTIEHALIQLTEVDTEGQLKKIFEANNASLKWNHATKVHSRYTLFSSKDITEENIDTVVKAVILCCIKHRESDVFRMVKFLVNASKPNVKRMNEGTNERTNE